MANMIYTLLQPDMVKPDEKEYDGPVQAKARAEQTRGRGGDKEDEDK